VAVQREEAKSAGASKVEEMLKGLSPDDLSPREALEALYALKREAG
jgi:DNA mismatch repair protein MutS